MSDNSNVETRRKRIKDFIPSNARWLLTDLLGIDKTFTEDDLTRDEMQYLKDNLSNIISRGSFVNDQTVAIKPGGTYDSAMMGESNLLNLVKKSYDPRLSLRTALGNATLDLSGGQAVIKDKYDFEVEPSMYKDASLRDILTENSGLSAYDLISAVAGKFGSDAREGEGKPVSINLGTLEDLGLTQEVLKRLISEQSTALLEPMVLDLSELDFPKKGKKLRKRNLTRSKIDRAKARRDVLEGNIID
tara:strand:- start:38 stop:775 length:738 start_codon:yes stop_codon:yes gene_type:complete